MVVLWGDCEGGIERTGYVLLGAVDLGVLTKPGPKKGEVHDGGRRMPLEMRPTSFCRQPV